VWALEMTDGAAFTFEGSGNLRSCRSVENVTLTNDAELCRFHASWIRTLIEEARCPSTS
jgi:hypothetical protein